MINKVIQGDCQDILKTLPENSVDSICCDPPYELGFMGKSWDNTGIANNPEMWKECLRVLKPGGHLLSFGGTRTYHRMVSAIEDAGFEVRDMIEWVYGCLSEDTEILTSNGWKMLYSVFEGDYVFACDYKNDMKLQLESVKQKFIYDYDEDAYHIKDTGYYNSELMETDHIVSKNHNVLVSESWGVDCYSNGEYPQKVFAEILYENVEKRKELGYKSEFHIPGLNGYIPCTIEKIHYKGKMWCVEVESGAFVARRNGQIFITGNSGFPKSLNISLQIKKKYNIGLCTCNVFEPMIELGYENTNTTNNKGNGDYVGQGLGDEIRVERGGDKEAQGEAKNKILSGKSGVWNSDGEVCEMLQLISVEENWKEKTNTHSTVKPIALMSYLIKMITPKGGIVLDPFAGSGSTLVAAKQNGFQFIGIEMTENYIPIIEARLKCLN